MQRWIDEDGDTRVRLVLDRARGWWRKRYLESRLLSLVAPSALELGLELLRRRGVAAERVLLDEGSQPVEVALSEVDGRGVVRPGDGLCVDVLAFCGVNPRGTCREELK